MDLYDRETRSYVMSRIRGRDTKAEVRLRKRLWAYGLRGYRTHAALPGRPDVVWAPARVAVFVDGCFWHGCPTCRIPTPASRSEYWAPKLGRNKIRDRHVDEVLQGLGWTTIRVWEHQVRDDLESCVEQIAEAVRRFGTGPREPS